MEVKQPKIKTAYEVYSLQGGGRGYGKRLIHGYAWTENDAHVIGKRNRIEGFRYHVNVIHLVEVDGLWHRINVQPVVDIEGNESQAEISRIAKGDFPKAILPAIYVQAEDFVPDKLPLDLEKAINKLAALPKDKWIRLYTQRAYGPKPLVFTSNLLLNDERVQMEVATWLKTEIDLRLKHYANHPEDQGDENEAA